MDTVCWPPSLPPLDLHISPGRTYTAHSKRNCFSWHHALMYWSCYYLKRIMYKLYACAYTSLHYKNKNEVCDKQGSEVRPVCCHAKRQPHIFFRWLLVHLAGTNRALHKALYNDPSLRPAMTEQLYDILLQMVQVALAQHRSGARLLNQQRQTNQSSSWLYNFLLAGSVW